MKRSLRTYTAVGSHGSWRNLTDLDNRAVLGFATKSGKTPFARQCQTAVDGHDAGDAGVDAEPHASWVIPSYTRVMKTAISVSDETFDRVSRTASELGMSRSEFFARAAQRYLDELDAQSLTVQIDSALERLDGTDEAEAAAVAIGHRVLDAADDEW